MEVGLFLMRLKKPVQPAQHPPTTSPIQLGKEASPSYAGSLHLAYWLLGPNVTAQSETHSRDSRLLTIPLETHCPFQNQIILM